ncbi:MAG: hypothetical protein Q9159_004043 [Coniocarpon cinnabarinum]
MDPSAVDIPPLKDLSIDNITDNVKLINSQCDNPRTRYVLERLVQHLHDFARETRLQHHEWMQGLEFLTRVGHTCTEHRQEFILLSDVFGLSLLVDSISHPKPSEATAGTVLGPFHTHDAPELPSGESIANDPSGGPLLCLCTIRDTAGRPVEGVHIDVWETDSTGHYDVQRPGNRFVDGRAVLKSDANGKFWYKAIVPVSYPIPHDGPVGQLLKLLKRHPMRPAHMHFMFHKEGYDELITALYIKGDPYENSDAVFGVKDSLVVTLGDVNADETEQYGVPSNCKTLKWDFVMVDAEQAQKLKDQEAMRALEKQGKRMKLLNHLPVPDVD